MKQGYRKRAILPSLCAIVAVAIPAAALRPREHPLLPRSVRIAAIGRNAPYYWWLSGHELMVARDTRRAWTLVRLDETTKRETPMSGLSRLFSASNGRPETVQVSPDGKWALWTGASGGTFVSAIDGSRHFECPAGKSSEKRWMCESLRWVELLHDDRVFTGAIIHNVFDPHAVEKRVLVPTVPCLRRFVNVAGMTPTTDDHILVSLYNGREGNLDPAGVLALGMTAHLNEVGQFQLHAPRPLDRGEITFDPMSGRLAWILEYRPPFTSFTGLGPRVGIWVSSMFGWKAHEVGSIAITGGSGSRPSAVKWSPDGTRLSFVYGNGLWTIPAG